MEIRAFLGLVGHYRQFIKGFTQIAQLLNEHLAGEGASSKSEWVSLSEDALEAFQALKQPCMSCPILAFANYKKDFLLKTGTSKEGLGVVLSQKQADRCYHPVAYGLSWPGGHAICLGWLRVTRRKKRKYESLLGESW